MATERKLSHRIVDELVTSLRKSPSPLIAQLLNEDHWPDLKKTIGKHAHKYMEEHEWMYRYGCSKCDDPDTRFAHSAFTPCPECQGKYERMVCSYEGCPAIRDIEDVDPNKTVGAATSLCVQVEGIANHDELDIRIVVPGRDSGLRGHWLEGLPYRYKEGSLRSQRFTSKDVVSGWEITAKKDYLWLITASRGITGAITVVVSSENKWKSIPPNSQRKRYKSLKSWLKASGLQADF